MFEPGRSPTCPSHPEYPWIPRPWTVPSGSFGHGTVSRRAACVFGVSSLPVASARAQTRMSSSFEYMPPAAPAQEKFQSVTFVGWLPPSSAYAWACGFGIWLSVGNEV